MRKKNSVINVIVATLCNFLTIIIGLVAQAIFIKTLGTDYLGINSLFQNIISMLSVVELGLGSAIIYNLYKPIAENDENKIYVLLKFYKKSYHVISLIILVIGIIICPFLPKIVNISELPASLNIYIIFMLFLIDSVFSYFLSYKRSILYASQKNYIINIVHILYLVILNIIQVTILFLFKSYVLYLAVKILMRIIENLIISVVANRMYPFINKKSDLSLDKETEKDIFKRIKALFLHKVSSFIINSTDNIIISKFLGLTIVGLYANYYLIINSVQTIMNQIIQSTTASVGNLLVTESKEKQYEVFKKIRFINFVISNFSACSICIIIKPFITIWIGEKYLLSFSVLLVLCINYYLSSTRSTYITFKDASGICYEDRFVPIVESVINIVVSIVLVKLIGLQGVFIGTLISSLILWLYSYPKYIYKEIFNKKIFDYFKETIGYFIIFVLSLLLSNMIASYFCTYGNGINFIISIIIALLVPNIIIFIVFSKNENFKYFILIAKKIIKKLKRKKHKMHFS